MKKYILLAAVAISLAACNSEDNYTDDPVALHISATIGQSATSRASDASWKVGDLIGVSMSGRYSNIKYTNTSGSKSFEGAPMYFKNKVEPVDITAYYPFTGKEDEMPGIVEVSTTADRQTSEVQPTFDFLYAAKENVTGSEPNVELAFSHKMSKLTLIFKNGNDGTDVSRINACEINGLVLEGSFDPATGVCAAKTGIAAADLSFNPTVTNGEELPPFILFPQDAGKVTLKIHDRDNQSYSCELNFLDSKLVSGNNYQFTVTVFKTSMSVNASINDWEFVTGSSEAKSDVSND